MSVLSDKAKKELICSIISFLNENNLIASAKNLQEESQFSPTTQHNGLLERKWVTVARLQKKAMDLEKQIADLQSEIDKNVFRKKQHFDFTPLPKSPSRHILEGHKQSVLSIAIHPKFTILASASEDSTIRIYDYESGEFERTLKGHTKAINSVAFSPDGSILASASADTLIKFWDTSDEYQCIKTGYGHDHSVSMLCFHPNGKLLYSCSRDLTIREWNVSTAICENVYYGHNEWIRCLDIHENGNLLASSGNDNAVYIWDTETKQEQSQLAGHDHVVETLKFVPKICNNDVGDLVKNKQISNLLISAGRDKVIKLWNISTNECIFNFVGHENWIRSLCVQFADIPGDFEYPSCIVSVADDRTIRIWDMRTGKLTKMIENAHDQFITFITNNIKTIVSPHTANMFATASNDLKIKIWQAI